MGNSCCLSHPDSRDESKATATTKPLDDDSNLSIPASPQPIDANGAHSVPSTSNFSDHSPDSDREQSPPDEARQRLLDFYRVHNPDKLQNATSIDIILRKYKGNEDRLFADLHQKYGLDPASNATASAPDRDSNSAGKVAADLKSEKKEESDHDDDAVNTPSDPPSAATNDPPSVDEAAPSQRHSALKGVGSLKIEVSNPNKFKAATKGTALFGTATPKKTAIRHHASSSSTSHSTPRSTSFIIGSPDMVKGNRPVCGYILSVLSVAE